MKERERILELVKNGVISTEEALILLENVATEKDEKLVRKEAANVKPIVTPVKKEETESQVKEEQSKPSRDQKEQTIEEEVKDRKRLEKILDDLATEANKASVELDSINAEISELESSVKEKEEQIMVLNTMEEMEELSEDKLAERQFIENENKELKEALDELYNQRSKLEDELKDIRKEQREESWENWSKKFEIPDDWKDTATETLNQMSEKMSEAGTHLGHFIKKTVNTVAEVVNDNVDWKDVNLKVPGVASTKFEHEFYYPETKASLLNVKVANGEVEFKTWDSEDLKVTATIKLYGKMDADSPFEAFLERSEIDVDDETISFQIPNKRIRADLTFYLPKRMYDHISVKILNGNVKTNDIEVKDIYVKSTNGDMVFSNLTATMLEVEGVNGEVKVTGGSILDLLVESVNGTILTKAAISNSNISIINGDIKITGISETISKIEASSVNGNVKLALPATLGIDGTAKTSLGNIHCRLSDYETIREKKEKTNQLLQFRRLNESNAAYVKVNTTTGSIYLKDTDQ